MKSANAESKKSLVYDYLKKKIISNQLKPVELLNEAELATELQVSKTPVREALQQLEKDGLIDNIPQKGWFVSEINIKDIRELFEIREILECSAVKMAILKADINKFIALRNKLSEIINGKNPSNLLKSGEMVHTAIIESLQNRWLLEMYKSLMEHYSRTRIYFVHRFNETRLEDSSAEHTEILDAIIAKDAVTAEELMRKHLYNGFTNIKRLSIDF